MDKEKSRLELGRRDNGMMECRRATDGRVKKRKAESQDINNERLSKRLGLLNLGLHSLAFCFMRDLADIFVVHRAQWRRRLPHFCRATHVTETACGGR